MRFTIPVVLILLLFISPCSAAAETGYATVFVYHKFNEPKSPSTSIATEEFEAQLSYLRDNHYNVISLPDLVALIRDKTDIPPKTVVITIDDGYKSVYTHAFPMLKKYGFPFTIFLYMEAIDRYPDFMSSEAVRDIMKYKKATFGNHSYSHQRLARWPEGMSRKEYLKLLEADLLRSQERFKKILGIRPEFYAFPYGEYNQEFVKLLKKHGYTASFTQDPASTGGFSDIYLLPRYASVGSWAKMDKFSEFLLTEPLNVDNIYPPYGLLKENPPDRIEGRIINHGIYKNPGIYVSEFGWIRPEVDKENGTVTAKITEKLNRKVNRIGFTAINRETGRESTYFYMIILK
ncbi:Polysaccharide deacetylase [hydrothermal vent metagenome]|uniref:Polysaccharide deacetylase n=1 Tax=hydrothermal vent metagenome TaxID=652676 RepID=A0A3B1D6P9_9ZZZZ